MKSTLIVILVGVMVVVSGCSTNNRKFNKKTAGTLPIYGNWCGPEHPKDTRSAPEPIDHLDASCKEHDLCYEEKGYFNCSCDAKLTKEIRDGLRLRVYKGNERRMARTVHNYFKASPCHGDDTDKVTPTRVLQKAYKSGEEAYKNGEKAVKDIWDKFSDDEDTANPKQESPAQDTPTDTGDNAPEMI